MTIRKVRNHFKRQVWGELGKWMHRSVKKVRNLVLEEKKKQARSINWGAKQMMNMARLQQRMYTALP